MEERGEGIVLVSEFIWVVLQNLRKLDVQSSVFSDTLSKKTL